MIAQECGRKLFMRHNVKIAISLGLLFGSYTSQIQSETLKDALATAYQTNPQLLETHSELRATDEGVAQALANWRPNVQLTGTLAQQRQQFENDAFDDLNTGKENTSATIALQIDQALYRGGRTASEVEKAEHNVLLARSQFQIQEQQILLGALTAYLDVFQNRKILKLRQESESILRQQLKAVNDRFEVGELTRTDVAQAESRLAAALAETATARGNLKVARASYFQFIGQHPQKLAKPELLIKLPATINEALAAAESANPNVVAAGQQYRAAVKDVDIAIGLLKPQLTLQAVAQRNFPLLNDEAKDLAIAQGLNHSRFIDTFSLTLNLTVPLYQQGLRHSQVRQAKQTVSQAKYALYRIYRQVAQATKQAWENVSVNRKQITAFQKQVAAARIAFDGITKEALLGSRSVLDVLDIQQELIAAQINLETAIRNERLAAYQLHDAIGYLTAKKLNLDVAYYDHEKYYNDVRNKWFGTGDTTIPNYPYTETYVRDNNAQ